jgi:hypothetical protein
MQLFQKLQELAPDLKVLLHPYQIFIRAGLDGGEKMRKRQVLIDERSIAKDVVVVTNNVRVYRNIVTEQFLKSVNERMSYPTA